MTTDKDRSIAVMRAHGIQLPQIVYEEAFRTRLPLNLACALLDQESGGGHNIFGHDPTICVGWGSVTRLKYTSYRVLRRRSGKMQGVGPCQLTWWATQDEADREGGCWQPRFNMRVGFRHLQENIGRYGLNAGIAAYNGSGVAAHRYADAVIERSHIWGQRLA